MTLDRAQLFGSAGGLVAAAPWAILLGFVALLATPPTRPFAERLLLENRPVELLTFILLAWAAIGAAGVARQTRLDGGPWWAAGFFWAFAALCFVVAMEEIAWGQQFLHYETPSFMQSINVQGEVTLHNFRGHNSAIDLFLFGVVGLVGIVLATVPALRRITPPAVLVSWFLAITLAGGADAFTDQTHVERLPIYIVAWIGEVVEMLVAMTCALYVFAKRSDLASRG